jgi:ATP-dependent helicase/nuclease subunit B
LANIAHAVERAAIEHAKDPHHEHPVVARMSDTDRDNLDALATTLIDALIPLETIRLLPINELLDVIRACLAVIAPDAPEDSVDHNTFDDVLDAISAASAFAPSLNVVEGFTLIMALLRAETVRDAQQAHPRLAIFGLAEARMMVPDLVVLGGLNEGKWPEQVDPGPWLNRSMRQGIGLEVPERLLGLTAHDFAEAFARTRVILTWSKRDQQQPLVPSRWILRLRMLMEGFGVDFKNATSPLLLHQAQWLDAPEGPPKPLAKPRPKPPKAARPHRFSVTDIVKLNRDPYAIYARKVLMLEPVEVLGAEADARLRGTLFHEAIGNWNADATHGFGLESLSQLLAEGRKSLAPLERDARLHLFWSSRFERIAKWLVEQEQDWQQSAVKVFSEQRGELEFLIGQQKFVLRGIADRIDILGRGARIIDYKTSTSATPSKKIVLAGWDPQLTLEAAMLRQGAFKQLTQAYTVSELAYVQITGGATAGKVVEINAEATTLATLADEHLDRLKQKLFVMSDDAVAYLPRVHMKSVDDTSTYDHLSRFLEWSLAEVMS